MTSLRANRNAVAVVGALGLLSLAMACTGKIGPLGTTPGMATSGTGGGTGTGTGSTGAAAGTGGAGTGATGGSSSVPTTPVIADKAIHRLSNVEYDNTIRDLLNKIGRAHV